MSMDENAVAVAPLTSMRNFKVLIDQSPQPEVEDLPTPILSRSNSPLADPILGSHNKLVAVESRDGLSHEDKSALVVTEEEENIVKIFEESTSLPVSEMITAAPTPYPSSVMPPTSGPPPTEDYICHVCRRRLASAEMLRKHEELSALHEKNLKILRIANQKKRTELRSDVIRLRHVVDMPDGEELRSELVLSETELAKTQEEIEERANSLVTKSAVVEFPNGFTIDFAGCSWTGNKQTNEDRMLVGFEFGGAANKSIKGCLIADGHCGDHCADFLISNLIVNIEDSLGRDCEIDEAILLGFKKTDDEYIAQAMENQIPSGSTVIVLIFFQKSETELAGFVAHVGDSRAVMRSCQGVIRRLTQDHKPDRPDEHERLAKAGGHVVDVGNVWRVFTPNVVSIGGRTLQWGLAVSRAFGDLALKKPNEIVSAVPEVNRIEEIGKGSIFVVACDGIFDVLSDEETIQAAIENGGGAPGVVRAAYGKLSDDNLTAIVLTVDCKSVRDSVGGTKRHLSEDEPTEGKKVRLSYMPSELPALHPPVPVENPTTKVLTSSQFI